MEAAYFFFLSLALYLKKYLGFHWLIQKSFLNYFHRFENKIEGKILGPVNAPLFRLKKKFRIRFLIRGPKSMRMQTSLAKIIPKYKFSNGIKLSVDVDPINFN